MISLTNFIYLSESASSIKSDIIDNLFIKILDLNQNTRLERGLFTRLIEFYNEFSNHIRSLDVEMSPHFTNTFDFSKDLETWKQNHDRLYLLYDKNTKDLVGFSHVMFHLKSVKNAAYISIFYISKEYRNSGIGRYFLNQVNQSLFDDVGVNVIILGVVYNNEPAKHLYLSNGFRPTEMKLVKFRK